LLLAVSGAAIAAEPTAAPLPAGKPGGVKNAQLATNTLVLIGGAAVVAAGIAMVASDGDDAPPATSTATGTTP
jgi:hypothetical protein